ncbi:2'-5' RNA ligase [Bacillus pseudomycoides]|uniref:2'-5' RNA ligase family protein n=1 Tax=Bacillus TaxID=1386 RepID=UPI000BED4287|nr:MULTISPECIES: 2'-5' RNA ligase family protein [Bacillus]PDX97231.1 2'-5' RNA ligase [Bacillus pseudomycoides]PEK73581.1 2'-5' RNA ligase [Bacillus pseudomycoides]PEN00864.1 2'-5' RNA ligase [Bacillus pseudomycoides]PGB76395.1 2'-5' RNA ligase [Bacillus pseudomycoides]WIY62119.1 2'-5' RNA ligase family protein [Bacillus arachidis]
MKFFIGIIPPESYLHKIQQFQRQWENNRIVEVVEPHITVKAQGGLTSDQEWLKKVEKVCKQIPSFTLSLGKPQFFGKQVLFLSVEDSKVYKLHRLLVEAVSPSDDLIKRYMEMEQYHPHLTLGQTHWGLTSDELVQMEQVARDKLTPYPEWTVNFIRIYQEIEENTYQPYKDIPLLNL